MHLSPVASASNVAAYFSTSLLLFETTACIRSNQHTMKSTLSTLTFSRGGRIRLLILAVGSFVSSVSAQLLIERPQGGPNEYRQEYADAHLAEVRFNSDVRITAITGWISGPTSDEQAAISLRDPAGQPLFSQSFSVHGAHGPAAWQGINSLAWDVPAGSYLVEYAAVGMPLAYPYNGPVHNVPQPESFLLRYGTQLQETSLPFGVRIYGLSLSAVPESSTIGFLGGLMLTAIAWRHHRQKRRRFVQPVSDPAT